MPLGHGFHWGGPRGSCIVVETSSSAREGWMMAWSTRQLAELAGTTVKTVRHYHEIGLLSEPERASNGYKQYRTEHLVRLLQAMAVKRAASNSASSAIIATRPPRLSATTVPRSSRRRSRAASRTPSTP